MKKIPLLLFSLFSAALASCVSVAAQPSYVPPPPPHMQPESNEWVACVSNQADRPRPVQVSWYGQNGIKDRCTETTTIQPGEIAVFRCQFRQSTPRVQLVAYGLRSGDTVLNTWIKSSVRDGRRQCGRSNSSTIIGQGRDLQVASGRFED